MIDEDYGMLEVWLRCLQRKQDDPFSHSWERHLQQIVSVSPA
ncbi:hypothetical protein [Acinetobacter sp. ANC 4654]|nr:hypothetical protein [Acinetobacter sp. ANC 4654]